MWNNIKHSHTINNALPIWARPYAQLMRLDRPIGVWLLLLPCWWSLVLASQGFPSLGLLFLFALGAVVMRGAGCVVNDIYDRKLDAGVERTRLRPLANREVKVWQALVFLVVLLLMGLGVLLLLNRPTILIGVLSLLLVFTYPLMKRVTWWPQLFLGLAFNFGALMGWSAVTGTLGLTPILLYAAGIFWTLGYDTIYAHQDRRDDALMGIKSTARLFGDRSKPWVALFYGMALFFLGLVGWSHHLGAAFYVILLLAAAVVCVKLIRWHMDDPESCLKLFQENRDLGLIVLAAFLLGKW